MVKTHPCDTSNSLGNIPLWIRGFTSSNGDHLDTTVRESGVHKSRPEASESAGVASANVFLHRALFPVPEASAIVVRCTTKHDDEAEQQQTEHGNDLD